MNSTAWPHTQRQSGSFWGGIYLIRLYRVTHHFTYRMAEDAEYLTLYILSFSHKQDPCYRVKYDWTARNICTRFLQLHFTEDWWVYLTNKLYKLNRIQMMDIKNSIKMSIRIKNLKLKGIFQWSMWIALCTLGK